MSECAVNILRSRYPPKFICVPHTSFSSLHKKSKNKTQNNDETLKFRHLSLYWAKLYETQTKHEREKEKKFPFNLVQVRNSLQF